MTQGNQTFHDFTVTVMNNISLLLNTPSFFKNNKLFYQLEANTNSHLVECMTNKKCEDIANSRSGSQISSMLIAHIIWRSYISNKLPPVTTNCLNKPIIPATMHLHSIIRTLFPHLLTLVQIRQPTYLNSLKLNALFCLPTRAV